MHVLCLKASQQPIITYPDGWVRASPAFQVVTISEALPQSGNRDVALPVAQQHQLIPVVHKVGILREKTRGANDIVYTIRRDETDAGHASEQLNCVAKWNKLPIMALSNGSKIYRFHNGASIIHNPWKN
jgi:hypothetical protein